MLRQPARMHTHTCTNSPTCTSNAAGVSLPVTSHCLTVCSVNAPPPPPTHTHRHLHVQSRTRTHTHAQNDISVVNNYSRRSGLAHLDRQQCAHTARDFSSTPGLFAGRAATVWALTPPPKRRHTVPSISHSRVPQRRAWRRRLLVAHRCPSTLRVARTVRGASTAQHVRPATIFKCAIA